MEHIRELEKIKDKNVDAFYVCESIISTGERHIKRLIIIIILCILLLFISNGLWLYAWTQYDYIGYDQDGDGINNVNLGEQGNITNEPEIDNTSKEKTPQH